MARPANRTEYLDALGSEQRATLEQMLATIHAAAPDAEESFSYNMPGYTLNRRPLMWAAAWKHHFSMYPVNAAQLAAHAEAGELYECEGSTVRFSVRNPVPYGLVTRLVQARATDIAAGAR